MSMKRMKSLKKALSILCVFCMLLSVFANSAVSFASAEDGVTAEEVSAELGSASAGTEAIPVEASPQENQEPVSNEPAAKEPASSEPGKNSGAIAEEAGAAAEKETEAVSEEENKAASEEKTNTASEEENKAAAEEKTNAASEEESNAAAEEKTNAASEEEANANSQEEHDPSGDEPAAAFNSTPIEGQAAESGVTVQVSAPVGCFPDGTTISIHPVAAEENRVGFDIAFLDPSGARVQPADGQGVSLLFSISEESPLILDDNGDSKISVYHRNDDGTEEILKSVVVSDNSVQIQISASHFSEYGVVSEVSEESAAMFAETRDARSETSTNLEDFLVAVLIDAPTDENGNYIVNPNSTYEMTLTFSENEGLQFADEETLIYNFPDGVTVDNLGPTTFSITVVDENGTAVVSGSTFEVVDGQLRIRFNQNDPNFERLKAMANVKFDIIIASSYEQNEGEITFAPGIVKEFTYDNSADVNITKAVAYDMDSDTASYVLQVSSAGLNENVVIEDHLTGTALIFNQDVVVESNLNGTISVTPDYSAVENGFRLTLPQLEDGEVLTLRYTAAVDYTKISGRGSVEQTNNTARVTSDQVPDGKEASADFHGQISFERIKKIAAGEPEQISENQYLQTWTITVNENHKLQVGGTEISDWITPNSRPFMQFTGDGIEVKVTFEDGSTETRTLTWDELTGYGGDDGRYGWGYMTPASDGKAAYEITCTTLIDTTNALNELTLVNGAQIFNTYVEGTTNVGIVGDGLDIKKDALGTTSDETDWAITVTVPGTGLPDLRVVDDAPRVTYEGQTYMDTFIRDSFEVDGLLEGESWKLYVGSDEKTYTLTFYQSETQNDANMGVLPTPDGQPRDIVIRFKTAVNQDWLNLAAENGYQSGALIWHVNNANARSGDYRTPTVSDKVFPTKPDFEKSFVERGEAVIDGVTYPVFRYKLRMTGPTADGIVIHDTFNTEYLKYYEEGGIRIMGGITSIYDANGTISAADTPEGMDITVSSFPKNTNLDAFPHEFYPVYEIEYSLIAKDQAALDALNEAAAASGTGVLLQNTAAWDDLTSDAEFNYSYFPYVDKELLSSPSAENGYVAEFKLMINMYAEDLDPTSDVLVIRDILSDNLRFLPDSLTISPEADSIEVQHDTDTNTITFLNVPDETAYEITYQAKVLGQGNVTYSNTIQFGKYEKTIEENTTVTSSGGGTASNPSITLVKRDAESISSTLAGAVFDLYYMQGDTMTAVTDRDGQQVSFTTGADGSVLIIGNQTALGWALWTDRTYYLVETAAPAGYELNTEPIPFVLKEFPSGQLEYSITGETLNVQNVRKKTEVSVEKQWIGPAAGPVTVSLLANGETVDEVELSADNQWKHTFTDLPQCDDDGSDIAYTVTEADGGNYSLISIDGSAEDGFVITNFNTDTTEVPVTKAWVGPEAPSVMINLLANGEAVDEVELNAENNWQHTFTDLPKYDSTTGLEITYTVTEEPLENYSTAITGDAETGFTISNTNIEKIEIPVTKTWIGPEGGSVTVNLLADGEQIDTAELNADSGWQYTFTDLPKYDSEDGHEIVYNIAEDAVENYSTAVTGDAANGFTITNTSTETVEVPVTKTWVGPEGKSVTVNLLADGEQIDTAELNADGGWQHTFTDLPKYDSEDGHEIVYDVQEDPVPGYEQSRSGSVETGFTFINTIAGKVSIPVTKVWIGPAAESVTVELLADGVKAAEAVLSEENNWQYTFADLDQYNNGAEIVYTIQEVDVEGYSSEITGDQSGFTITNTKTDTDTETIEIPVRKKWVGSAAKSVTINLLADGKVISEAELNEANGWQHVFTDLPKYGGKDNHEIVYTITENAVNGYTTSIKGNMRKGFVVTNTKTSPPRVPGSSRTPGTPKTGDESRPLFYLMIMLLAGAGIVCTLLAAKRKKKRQDT